MYKVYIPHIYIILFFFNLITITIEIPIYISIYNVHIKKQELWIPALSKPQVIKDN